jgi:hypothetical protein
MRALVVLLALGACREPVEVGRVSSAVNGEVDTTARYPGVLGMFVDKGTSVARCTGVLLGPNLVLTARHCVSPTRAGGIVCGSSPLGTPFEGMNALVTTDPEMPDDPAAYVRGARMAVPPDGTDECGFDIALVVLEGAGIDPSEATPYEPRLERPVATGELLTAVGYGTSGSGGLGRRRYREGAPVACLGGADCAIPEVQPTEFMIEDGFFCTSDSGAPSFDADGRVVGVTSKGIDPCVTPIVSSVFAWSEWIRRVAIEAANEGGYAAAAWAVPVPDAGVPDAGLDAGAPPAPIEESGCAVGGGSAASGLAALPWIALGVFCRRKRG